MKRDGRINIRVPTHEKLQWEAWAKDNGYANLTLFIEDAVADYGSRLKNLLLVEATGPAHSFNAQVPSEEPLALDVFHTLSQKLTHAHAHGQQTVPGSDTSVCPNEAFHRKGVFCKSCRRVIQKG